MIDTVLEKGGAADQPAGRLQRLIERVRKVEISQVRSAVRALAVDMKERAARLPFRRHCDFEGGAIQFTLVQHGLCNGRAWQTDAEQHRRHAGKGGGEDGCHGSASIARGLDSPR
jgi:hypothetical protein